MTDSKISVALVGGGTIAPLHARYLQSSLTAELIAIIDPFSPGEELAKQLGVAYFKSVTALLESAGPHPDTYVVCVPSSLHMSVSQEIIEKAAPRAILIEKPFSTDSHSGSQLVEFARQKNCTLVVGHHRRFNPWVSAAKAAIQAGRIGIITAISGLWTTKKNDGYYTEAPWRCSRSAGGGPIWTNFVHDIDVLHYLTGSRIVRIWATATASRREHDVAVEKEDQVEEGAAIMLQFGNGVVGTFVVCDNVASPYGWESATGDNPMYAPASAPVDCYRIFGTKGTLSEPDGILWTYRPEEALARALEVGWNIPMSREQVEAGDEIPFQQQTEHFVRVIRGLEEPRCSGDDGLAAVKVCEAVIEALTKRDGIPILIE
jgi:predicted dehydrogenase